MRKKVCWPVLLLVLIAVIGWGVNFVPATGAGITLDNTVNPNHIVLTWRDDPRTTQTITWRTRSAITAARVQYSEAVRPELLFQGPQTGGQVEKLATNTGEVSICSATLTGLRPGRRYLYRVGNDNEWSEPHSFTTAPAAAANFKFLVFGDSQSSNYAVWQNTVCRAYQANTDAAFLVNVGDLVDTGQDFGQWEAWFEAAREVVDVIPAMPVTGNHETYTPARGLSLPLLFSSQFKLPVNGPDGLTGRVYSFDYGDAHFIMLDSQAGEERRFIPDMLARQKVWLENDLRATNKKWKLVFIHRSPYNNKLGETNENIRAAWGPVFDKYRVDVVFTGHDHVYARTYPLRGGVAVTGRAAGTTYVASGRSGTKTYNNVLSRDWDEFFYNPLDEPNYIVVEIKDGNLTVKAFRQSGSLIDAGTI